MTLPPCACGAELVYAGVGVYPRNCPACRLRRHHETSERCRQARKARDPERFRKQARIAKRRKSTRRYTGERAHLVFCPWRMGPHYVCMGRLETIVLPGGATASRCPKCTRREAGICQHCNHRVYGKSLRSLYCAEHRYEAKLRDRRRYTVEHLEEIIKKVRAKRHAKPEVYRTYARDYRRRRKLRVLRGAMAPRNRQVA